MILNRLCEVADPPRVGCGHEHLPVKELASLDIGQWRAFSVNRLTMANGIEYDSSCP